MLLLHQTLYDKFPLLYPHLAYLTEMEIQKLPETHFQGDEQLDALFRRFHTDHILLLREIDHRIQTLLAMKNESSRFRQVLNDLQSRRNNNNTVIE